MTFKRVSLLLCTAVALISTLTAQQEPAQHPRPKIGLVLEGGGALGLAHVGVIQWLEENHVPVDYVAGTSIGGLIGGLYASGKSPEELKQLVTGVDWDEVLRDEVQYQDLSFRRKEDHRDYPNSLEFGLKNGVRFPSGFNAGYRVGLILNRELLPYSNLKNFDQLPIPFRCVAVDMVARREHVFKDGSLTQALRSTMSIPAIFSPVRESDQVYVDGGLLNNLPVDVARQMGADLVLAVHLQTRSLDAKEPLSSFGVMAEAVSVVVAANELRSMERADVVITVDSHHYTSGDYDRVKKLIELGYQAAAQKSAILKNIALDDNAWQQYVAARDARKPAAVPVPQFVTVTGTEPTLARNIRRTLTNDVVGKPVDADKIERELTYVIGTGRFASLDYQMTSRNDVPGLLVHATEKEYAPPLLNPLLVIDGFQTNNVRFALGARITTFGAADESEMRTDAIIGSEYGLTSEYYRPFGRTRRWFVAPRGQADSSPLDLWNRRVQLAGYRVRKVSGALDFGVTLTRNSQLRVGYETGRISLSHVSGTTDLQSSADRLGVSSLRYRYDRLDDPIIPRSGGAIDLGVNYFDSYLNGNRHFASSEITLRAFKPVSDPATVFLTGSGGTDFNHRQQGLPSFNLGSPLRLAAYGRNEILTDQYFLFRAGYLHRLVDESPILARKIYAIGFYEAGKAYGVANESRVPMDGAAGFLLETAFGPVLIGGSYGDTGHRKIFFQLGRVF
jgi:NTE family protein